MDYFLQSTAPKPPGIEDPIRRTAWDETDRYWREVIAPALTERLAEFMKDSKDLIRSVDLSLRTAESRMQIASDKFETTADSLTQYMVMTEATIGSLKASDTKQDQSISDLWSRINSIHEKVQVLENSLSIVQHTQMGLRNDIYGDATTNTPGIHGILREMRQEIVGKLSGIESQQAISTVALQQHERDIAIIKGRKGFLRRIRLFIAGE